MLWHVYTLKRSSTVWHHCCFCLLSQLVQSCLQVRLLMSYVITHPEKMDDARQQQWQKLAHLTDIDMNTINNLELLGVPVKKRGNTKSGLGLTFGRKRKRAVRKVTSPLLWQDKAQHGTTPAACKALCLGAEITSALHAASMLLAQCLLGVCSLQ